MVALYATAVFLYWVALYLYVPTLPAYVRSKTDSLSVVGVVLAQYGLWQGIIRLPLGIAADWLGRRKAFILVGCMLAGLGALTLGLAHGVSGLIVGRAVVGLAAGTWVPLVAVFSSLFPPHESVRASALLTLIGTVGRMLATGVTGWLNEAGGYSLPFFLAAGAAGAATLVLLPAPESRRLPRRPSLASIGRLITRRDVLLPALLAAISQYAIWGASFSFIPILATELGASGVTTSMLVSANLAMVVLGNFLATAVTDRVGGQRLIYLSFILLCVGLGGAALAPTLPLLFGAQLCIGLSQGIGYPVLMGMSIRHVEDANRTTATGLHQAVYAAGMFSGPWLSGILADGIGVRVMFGLTSGAILLLSVLVTRQLVDGRRDDG
jgi:MFS family permease